MAQSNFKEKRVKLSPDEYDARKKEVLERDGYRCRICLSMTNLEVDHIQKRSQVGGDEHSNLRVLCRSCHNVEDNSIYSKKRKSSASTEDGQEKENS